jgi:hypothetical protein
MKTEAYISADRKYRYWLLRVWDSTLPVQASIGVNPSTADERMDDPTIRKDMGFARRLGFGGLLKLNVGAYRATDPKKWRKVFDPIGPENSAQHLVGYVKQFNATQVFAAWGKNGNYFVGRCEAIIEAFPDLRCFGHNSDGTPRHTLMLPYSTPVELLTPVIETHYTPEMRERERNYLFGKGLE